MKKRDDTNDVRVAAIQMASGPQVQANLLEAQRSIAQAADNGARLVVLPENFALMGERETDKLQVAEAYGHGPIQDALSRIARRHGVWIVGGTIALRSQDPSRVFASCLVYDDHGQAVGRFDKIHLFDVTIADSDETYTESATLVAGATPVVIPDTPVGTLGLAVCYDLRFPELFRRMAELGARVFALPAAFTEMTGRAHWDVLVRARAIENLSYVIAAAQGGYHSSGRETHGNSMIVEPWGGVVARRERGSGPVLADLDLSRVERLRSQFPVLAHRQL